MTAKRILGIVILLGGITLIAFSTFLRNYGQVESEKFSEPQEELQGQLVPRRPFPGTNAEEGAENNGESFEKVNYSRELSLWSKVSGIVFIFLGAGLLLIKPKPRK